MTTKYLKQYRTEARPDCMIKVGIEQLKTHARPGLRHIHLIECDFARVKRDPNYFDATMQPNGRIVTVFNSRLIELVALT